MKKTKILLPIMLFALCSCGETGKTIEYNEGVKALQQCVNNVDTYDAIGFNANLKKYDLTVYTKSYKADVETGKPSSDSTIANLVEASVNGQFDVAVSGLTSATSFNELKASVKANVKTDVKSAGESVFGDNKGPVNLSAQAVLDEGNVYFDVNEQLKNLISDNAGVEIPKMFYMPLEVDESSVTFPLFNADLIENGIDAAKAQIEDLIANYAKDLSSEQLEALTPVIKNAIASFVSFKEYNDGKYEVSVELNKDNLTSAVNMVATEFLKIVMGNPALDTEMTDAGMADMVNRMTNSITDNFEGINHIKLSAMFSEKAFLSTSADVDVNVKVSSSESGSSADGEEISSVNVIDTYIDMKLKSSTTLSFGEDVKVLTIANKKEYTLVDLGDSGDNE